MNYRTAGTNLSDEPDFWSRLPHAALYPQLSFPIRRRGAHGQAEKPKTLLDRMCRIDRINWGFGHPVNPVNPVRRNLAFQSAGVGTACGDTLPKLGYLQLKYLVLCNAAVEITRSLGRHSGRFHRVPPPFGCGFAALCSLWLKKFPFPLAPAPGLHQAPFGIAP